jgi:hypothetical protein
MSRPVREALVIVTASVLMAVMVLVSGEAIARTSPQINSRLTIPTDSKLNVIATGVDSRDAANTTATGSSSCWATDYPCRP